MICYFDCFSGISGDMVLGALVDAGVSPLQLKKELGRLPVNGYKLEVKSVQRAGMAATKVAVRIRNPKSEIRNPKQWKDIQKIIKDSSLSKDIKQKGLAIFKLLFQAEARVHGKKYDDIHLHELGAVDCIIDIFGTLIGLDLLGIEKIYASPVNLGGGMVKTEHGMLPVPAPATAALLGKAPVYSSGENVELTTPTGAVLLSGLAGSFGPIPGMQIVRIGMGAGTKDLKERPNVLRIFIGKTPLLSGTGQGTGDSITVIETNIDDMNPQVYEHVIEKLLGAGALDVYLTQISMKKGRPGIKLSVLCAHEKRTELSALLFRETSSIGIRFYQVQRDVLDRESRTVATRFGKIPVKISRLGKKVVQVTPEFEDCRKAARKHRVPLLEILETVTSRYYSEKRGKS